MFARPSATDSLKFSFSTLAALPRTWIWLAGSFVALWAIFAYAHGNWIAEEAVLLVLFTAVCVAVARQLSPSTSVSSRLWFGCFVTAALGHTTIFLGFACIELLGNVSHLSGAGLKVIGLCLMIVATLVSVQFSLAPALAVLRGLTPLEALRTSWKQTRIELGETIVRINIGLVVLSIVPVVIGVVIIAATGVEPHRAASFILPFLYGLRVPVYSAAYVKLAFPYSNPS